ncbi:Secondary metabolism regulator LAE1 [Colletotrichum trifolii]|uniref:Secondary metabolism regulator LAE1 n=1 Tax=Colletotrichum trifolii TaxID=5466 RepID=A0A4R8R9X7_COLTR|nr:Secondary metabolism regulator LAE1 [Colletotrichum trifolii]
MAENPESSSVAHAAGTSAAASPPAASTAAATSPATAAPAAVAHDNEVPVLDAEEVTDDSASELNSIATSSTSVSSSVLDYRNENGRTYHRYKDGKYNYPNDERELDRLDLQHNLVLLTFDNKLGNAPPAAKGSGVKRVLDVGTGTGIWANEFGEEHPDSEVTGIDLSASQPDFMPPNVKFEIDDIEEPWTFSQPFDYIHCRAMSSSLSDWKKFFQQCYDNLTPGGYLEVNDIGLVPTSDDGTLREDHALSQAIRLLGEAMQKAGRSFVSVPEMREVMTEVGFRDVTMNIYKWPMNTWPKHPKYKQLGLWCRENFLRGFEAFLMAPFTRIHGWTQEEVQVFLIDVRKDINDTRIHAYYWIYSLWGRKPTEEETAQSSS